MALCDKCCVSLIFLSGILACIKTQSPPIFGLDAPLLLDYTALFKRDNTGAWEASGMDLPYERPDTMHFNYHASLSEDGGVSLSWNFNEDNITFKVSARTLGWIAIGFSESEVGRANADFAVIGHQEKYLYIMDMHGDARGNYALDESQDFFGMYSWESEDETFAIFSRPLVTCDLDGDVDITADTMRILWSYGVVDPETAEPRHDELINSKSGDLRLKLLNPMLPPLELKGPETDIKTLDLQIPTINVGIGEFSYCMAFRFPGRLSKHHIVQFEPLIYPGNEYNVRQITVRQCSGKSQLLRVSHQSGIECEDLKPTIVCKTIVLTWSIGMSAFTYPDNVGYPIGGETNYFALEIRYLNPHVPDLLDSSGISIYYTSRLRQFDAGVMTTGSLVRESQIIPPRSPEFMLQGHCMEQCLTMALPAGGNVTIFAALLHAQETGRKIRLRHFRNGKELVPVMEDNRFHSLHQETQFLLQEVQLLKGDNMIVECTYNTFDRNEITYVNNSRGGESCLAYLSYYPKVEKLTDCETAPTENVVMDTVGAARLEEVKQSAEKFEWTAQQSRDYNARLLRSQVYVNCGNSLLESPQPVPKIKQPYVKKHQCKKEISGGEDDDEDSAAMRAHTAQISVLLGALMIAVFSGRI